LFTGEDPIFCSAEQVAPPTHHERDADRTVPTLPMVNPGVELFCEREIPTTIDKVPKVRKPWAVAMQDDSLSSFGGSAIVEGESERQCAGRGQYL